MCRFAHRAASILQRTDRKSTEMERSIGPSLDPPVVQLIPPIFPAKGVCFSFIPEHLLSQDRISFVKNYGYQSIFSSSNII